VVVFTFRCRLVQVAEDLPFSFQVVGVSFKKADWSFLQKGGFVKKALVL
jgi:hypothetical protein